MNATLQEGLNLDSLSSQERMDYEVKLSCAIKVQAVARRFIARHKLFPLLSDRYEKILDPKRRRYFYYDRQLDHSSWIKPAIFRNNDLTEISPTYANDEAAIMIQRQLHRCWALRRVRSLYKELIKQEYDHKADSTFYRNTKTGTTMWKLPLFMNGRLNHNHEDERAQYLAKRAKEAKAKSDAERIKSGIPLSESESEEEQKSDSDESAADENSEEMRRKRREKRKYPRYHH
jgi:hypothetical protein